MEPCSPAVGTYKSLRQGHQRHIERGLVTRTRARPFKYSGSRTKNNDTNTNRLKNNTGTCRKDQPKQRTRTPSTTQTTKWQLKLPGNGGGAATLFTYISCTFRHFPCEIGRRFFGINKHDRHLARSRKDRSERGPHHVKGTRYVGELFGRPVGSISCHSVFRWKSGQQQ